MSTWSREDLDRIGSADEVGIVPDPGTQAVATERPVRPDRATTVWIVRVGDELFVRSFRGPAGRWYQAARASGRGVLVAGGAERAVRFEPVERPDPAVDQAYREKYGRSGYVQTMVAPPAAGTTLRVVPA